MSSAVKLDKETLIKHRFWIALGAFAPLFLIAWLVLWLSVSGEITKKKGEYEQSVQAIDKVKDPKNDNYQKPMTEKKGKLEDHKVKVWGELYNGTKDNPQLAQWDLCVEWPFDPQKTPMLGEMYKESFGGPYDPQTKKPIEVPYEQRQSYRENLYKEYRDRKRAEFKELATPMNMDFDAVIAMPPIAEHPEYTPTTEELWLTQETVWVKRELMGLLQRTLFNIGYFRPVEDKSAPPAGYVNHSRFKNSNWEIDLLLRKGERNQLFISKNSTIKNINANKRTLPLREVKVYLEQANPNSEKKQNRIGPTITIQGDPLPWGEKPRPIGGEDVRIDAYSFNEKDPIYALQRFTFGTSPIKEIDQMLLGYQSSRTAFQALQGIKPDDDTSAAATQSTANTGGGVTKLGMTGVGGDMSGGTSRANASPLGINLKRYLQLTPQVRRMPIGIVLIMDQAYIEDLMAVFLNSRLRFLPTQLQWQQEMRPVKQYDGTESGRAPAQVAKAGGGGNMQIAGAGGPSGGMMMPGGMMGGGPSGGMMPGGMMGGQRGGMMGMTGGPSGGMAGGPSGGMMGMMGGMPPPGGGMMAPPGGATMGTATASSASEESDPNLVELALYGVISLYDRWQDPNAQQAAGAQATTTPGAATAPAPNATTHAVANPAAPVTPAPADGQPKAAPKPDGEPKTEQKAADDKKADEKKADEKKADEKPTGGEAKKADENKGN
jgi:hypothetical protein